MKGFYLAGSIVSTVLILILAFENIVLSISNFLFIFVPLNNAFVMVLAIAFIGFITGVFYTLFLSSALKSRQEDEEETGSETFG